MLMQALGGSLPWQLLRSHLIPPQTPSRLHRTFPICENSNFQQISNFSRKKRKIHEAAKMDHTGRWKFKGVGQTSSDLHPVNLSKPLSFFCPSPNPDLKAFVKLLRKSQKDEYQNFKQLNIREGSHKHWRWIKLKLTIEFFRGLLGLEGGWRASCVPVTMVSPD